MQWLMLQQKSPEDYVIATGRMETIRKFIELAATQLGWGDGINNPSIIWEGKGINEIGKRGDTKEIVIKIDQRYFRPTEVDELCGDASKARQKLGWKPSISLEKMIEEMIENDLNEARKEVHLKSKGFKVIDSINS